MKKDFNEIIQKTIELKNTIENEINKINQLYEATINEMNKSFQEKHEKLIKEEKDLKEKLENEVSKVKAKIENYRNETNNKIRISETINLGLKNLEKEDNNLIKTLSYASKINKDKKEMKKLLKELMRNITFSFNEENQKSNIKYDEYYFNGIPEPKNIQFKDITSSSFNLSWNIENHNLNNIDKNEISFKVEIKKENENEKYIQVYEGKNQNYKVQNLIENTNYEIKISSLYNEFIESKAINKKIKTKNNPKIDSVILLESKREEEFQKKLFEWSGYKRMELILEEVGME